MANLPISVLPNVNANGVTPTDLLVIVNYDVFTGTTKNITAFDLQTYITSGITDDIITGGTYSGGALVLNAPGGPINISGFTEPFSGGSGNCITDLYITNLHGCSPITVWDNLTLSGSVINSGIGGGELNLNSGVLLSNDNSAYTKGVLYIDDNFTGGYTELSSYNGELYSYSDTQTLIENQNNSLYLSNNSVELIRNVSPSDYTRLQFSNAFGYPLAQLEVKGADSKVRFDVNFGGDSFVIKDISNSVLLNTTTVNPTAVSINSNNSIFNSGITNSVIVGGSNITVTESDTTYVSKLNINTIGTGTSINNLGIDVNGNVVTGTTGGGYTYEIGEYVPSEGGVIFHRYIDGGNENYLVVSITDQGFQSWSNITATGLGASASSSWDGLSNSNAIVGQVGFTNGAALICLNYSVGLINDWYLPSRDELSLIWHNRFNLNKTLSGNSTAGSIAGASELFAPNYWSSTESGSPTAYSFGFLGGYANSVSGKGDLNSVRAVRNFNI